MAKNTCDLISTESREDWKATTSVGVERRVSFTWLLKNISCWPENCYDRIQSPPFSCFSSEWILRLFPSGHRASEPQFTVYLRKVLPETKITAVVKFYFKDKLGGEKYLKENIKCDFHEGESFCKIWSDTTLASLVAEAPGLLLDNILTIYCEVAYKENIVQEVQRACLENNTPKKYTAIATSSNTTAIDLLANDFEALLRQQKNCDVTLEVGNEKLPAHKLILGARSEVFAAMFERDTKESLSGVVTIIDIEPAVMKELLRYIYTGSFGEMTVEKATGLYVAADKYALPKLKSQCADFLVRNLSVDNVVDVAVLADEHNDGMIIDSVKMFAIKNATLLYTEKWKQLVEQNARLAYEITRALVSQNHENHLKSMAS